MTAPAPTEAMSSTQPDVAADQLSGWSRGVTAAAARAGCTEGQLYTMVISLVSASILVGLGGVPLGQPEQVAAAPLPPASTELPATPPVITPELVGVPSPLPPAVLPTGPATVAIPLPPMPAAVNISPPSEPAGAPKPVAVRGFDVPAPGAPRALTSDDSSVYTGTDSAGAVDRLVVLSRRGEPARSFDVAGGESGGGLSAATKHGSALLVTDRSRGVLLQLDPRTGQSHVLAELPDLPPCVVGLSNACQPGVQDLPPSPEGIALLGDFVYIADAAQGTIWRYALTTKQVTAWYVSADFPSADGPSGLAVDTAGRLVFTAAESADPAALLAGALYRLDVSASGAPGARTLLATFQRGTAPGAVAVGQADDVYVALRGPGGVVVVDRSGQAKAVEQAGADRIPAPGGLSLADGVLYVADSGQPMSTTSGRVHAVPVLDRPA